MKATRNKRVRYNQNHERSTRTNNYMKNKLYENVCMCGHEYDGEMKQATSPHEFV